MNQKGKKTIRKNNNTIKGLLQQIRNKSSCMLDDICINEVFSLINWSLELLENQSEKNIIKKYLKKTNKQLTN